MQPIAQVYVELAERIIQRLGSSQVRALHMQPPGGGRASEFCALELEDGSIGLSYVQLAGAEASLRARYGERDLAGEDVGALVRGFAGDDPGQRALGFAALNALSQQLFTRAGWAPPESGDPLGAIEPQQGEHIGMIGLFGPLIPKVRRSGARLTVLELNHDLVRDEENYRVTLDPGELASCGKVVSTCTIILNDTLDDVLAACRNARHFAVVGPTAGCVPDPLFERGVDTLGGRRVVDRERFLEAFCSGQKWGTYTDRYVITREDYPGVERLLAAAGVSAEALAPAHGTGAGGSSGPSPISAGDAPARADARRRRSSSATMAASTCAERKRWISATTSSSVACASPRASQSANCSRCASISRTARAGSRRNAR